ncbi:MAG TPA: hypothetical protein VFV70_00470 [Hyphomonadaceae bacterium]|nr:hypothetical protein [Hyphomonadaceae bacterium]
MHIRTALFATAVVASAASPAIAQVDKYSADAYAKPKYEGYVPPKNGYGQPDISGVWSNATTTPFERPAEFKDQLALSEDQANRVQGRAETYRRAGNVRTEAKVGAPEDRNTNLGYNRFWTDPGTQVMRVGGEPRSSLVTTTANGRVPPRKAGAPPIPRRTSGGADLDESNPMAGPRDNPEERGLSERCVFFPTGTGPVLRSVLYNNNYRISQGKDAVAIWVEMVHDTKIIRLNSKHRDDGLRPWMGDSIGWYEGNTLVVETTGFPEEQQRAFFNASDDLKVTERFTRVADNRLLYKFTVEDPKVWEKPWGGEYEFWASEGIYEYACHEGNYGMYGILAGGRESDRNEAVKPVKK